MKGKWSEESRRKRCGSGNPNWKGGISLDRKQYEKKFWQEHKKERSIIQKRTYKKHKVEYYKRLQGKFGTLEWRVKQARDRFKRRLREQPVLVTKEELKQLIQRSKCCYYCKELIGEKFEIEHKTPLCRGGKNKISNLVIACVKCNRSKGKKTAKEFIAFNKKLQKH